MSWKHKPDGYIIVAVKYGSKPGERALHASGFVGTTHQGRSADRGGHAGLAQTAERPADGGGLLRAPGAQRRAGPVDRAVTPAGTDTAGRPHARHRWLRGVPPPEGVAGAEPGAGDLPVGPA